MAGGVLFRAAEHLYFLPATVASKVLPMPIVARVPGAPAELVGIALVEGDMVPVVTIGGADARVPRRQGVGERARADNRPMLACSYLGERVALVGLEIIATGRFEPAGPQHVTHGALRAELFDVGALLERLRKGRWAV